MDFTVRVIIDFESVDGRLKESVSKISFVSTPSSLMGVFRFREDNV